MKKISVAGLYLYLCSSMVCGDTKTMNETPESWYHSGQLELNNAIAAQQINTNKTKNIILFIGDGMGVSTVTASRIFDGQSKGLAGEEHLLSFEHFPHVALSKTYNTNQQTPDSAGTMTAMMSGIKSKAGFIGVDQTAERGNCKSAQSAKLSTILDQAKQAGMSTGIVTTARITHATPAATYSHSPERDWESDADMPDSEVQAGCQDIATQLIDFSVPSSKSSDNTQTQINHGIDIILGGGRRSFLPRKEDNSSAKQLGVRKDGKNLIQEWLDKNPNGRYAANKKELDAIDLENTQTLLGLFNPSHMHYEADRANSEEPSLTEMTRKAIQLLQKNKKGFFLMVESGRIDHGHHAGNALRALTDTQEFSRAVQSAIDMVDTNDTLMIVTADHSHTLTIAGYPTRGNPILGKAISNDSKGNPQTIDQLAADKMPYTTLGYRNGPGHDGNGRKDLSKKNTQEKNFRQESLVPMLSESHAGEDVAIYAIGPWSHLFHKTHEQHYIFHVMQHSLGLTSATMARQR
ncbi:MAG: alkaline phosphatase [Cellvibrionaceae bacterium]